MKSVGEGVIEDLVAAQDDFATTEEIDEALANAEDLLHRFERFELNIGDTERDEVMEQLGEPLQQIKQIVKELERPKY